MRDNPLQFAAVREDPRLEREVLAEFGGDRLLIVASAGCTALALARWFPQAHIRAVDPNSAQLRHVESKLAALDRGAALDEHSTLAEAGNFESLFRMLREFVHDLVAPRESWCAFFDGQGPNPLATAVGSPMWDVAFELAFSEPLLVAMFGEAAIQHAAAGSYPGYFKDAFEDGLARPGARNNPFLHHVFLGEYRREAMPDYIGEGPRARLDLVEGTIESATFDDADFIGLSNVMDWMSSGEVEHLMRRLVEQTRPGTVVMWRQLNNGRPLHELLGPSFETFHQMGESLRARDRSLFYRSIHVCRRT